MKHFPLILVLLLAFVLTILPNIYLPYPLEFFEINRVPYELQEIDIGTLLGCLPGRITSVVIRNSKTKKEIWSYPTLENAKNIYASSGKCENTDADNNKVAHVWQWRKPNNIDFMVMTKSCVTSCATRTATIFSFDGNQVTQLFQVSGLDLMVNYIEQDFTAIYQQRQEECMACPKIWVRDEYKWDGKTYIRIKRELSPTKSTEPPWNY
jgi:hypothetical protein